jgi:formate dehydrogenase iron-sulfur subunit
MPKAILIDTTQCIGCRSCQVSCKEWNDLPAESTALPLGDLGLQNPATVSAKTLTLITYHEIADESAPGNLKGRQKVSTFSHSLIQSPNFSMLLR